MSLTVSVLLEKIKLDLYLMVGNRGILGATEYVAFLLYSFDQARGVADRLKGIEVGPVLHLTSEVLVTAPQIVGEHFG